MNNLSLYIHFPWCIEKCPYCDFNSHAVKSGFPESEYIDALLIDLEQDLQFFNISRPVSSLFMGGGTPSLFKPESIDRLLNGVSLQVALQENPEITLEANPGTFESSRFAEFRSAGINRLSIGVQSFNDQHLQQLGRVHTAKQAIAAAEIAHQSGFNNFNLDLMFGLPGGTFEKNKIDLETAFALHPSHISFYQLTLEPHTYFYQFPPKLPEADAIFLAQKKCQQMLAEHQYGQYEISAYSKQGVQCQHNLNYWRFGDYLGIGAGAHGKITRNLPDRITRSCKHKGPEHYLESAKNRRTIRDINREEIPLEFFMNHLRLKNGFDLQTFIATTALSFDVVQPVIDECLELGLMHKKQDKMCGTEKGWDFLDEILEKFIRYQPAYGSTL